MKSAKAGHKISVTGIRSVGRAANLLQLQTARNSTSEALIDQETFNNFNQPRRTFNSLQRAATIELRAIAVASGYSAVLGVTLLDMV